VRIRGWIERRGGPLITVWRLEQIELLARHAGAALERHAPPRLATQLPQEPIAISTDPSHPRQQQKAPAPK